MNDRMINRGRILGVALASLMVAAPVAGQRGSQGPAGPRATAQGTQVESVLRMRGQLDLSDQQIEELNGLRSELLVERSARVVAGMQVRSDLAAGEITRAEVRDQMNGLGQDRRERREAVKEQVESILTIDQREALLDLRERRFNGRGMRERGRSDMRGNRGRRSGPRNQ